MGVVVPSYVFQTYDGFGVGYTNQIKLTLFVIGEDGIHLA
jgi:hypothetical protein